MAHPAGQLARLGQAVRRRSAVGERRGRVEGQRGRGAPPGQTPAGAAHDLPEPAGEGGRVAQVGELLQRGEESVLGRVLGAVVVAEVGVGGGVGQVLEAPHELPGGPRVPAPSGHHHGGQVGGADGHGERGGAGETVHPE